MQQVRRLRAGAGLAGSRSPLRTGSSPAGSPRTDRGRGAGAGGGLPAGATAGQLRLGRAVAGRGQGGVGGGVLRRGMQPQTTFQTGLGHPRGRSGSFRLLRSIHQCRWRISGASSEEKKSVAGVCESLLLPMSFSSQQFGEPQNDKIPPCVQLRFFSVNPFLLKDFSFE